MGDIGVRLGISVVGDAIWWLAVVAGVVVCLLLWWLLLFLCLPMVSF